MPTPAQTNALRLAARQLTQNQPAQRISDFVGGVLGLNATQQADLVVTGFQGDSLADLVGLITKQREDFLDINGIIPTYVVYTDVHGVRQIAGIRTYLTEQNGNARLLERIVFHDEIRSALRALARGHYLEAVGAAILNGLSLASAATRGANDQGIDFIGRKPLIPINPVFIDGSVEPLQEHPGDKTFVLGSSKATRARGAARPVLPPAFIRELIGGWIIQRSEVRLWSEQGIKLLSPIQMVLLTTYRLSPDSKLLCNTLGVQIWNLPELVALVCLSAPDAVFNDATGSHFIRPAFRRWWWERHTNRLQAA
jgi:hypothetical protein